ncbi:MAG: FAD-binding and (Fe-S)-binding domain-containing protein [Halodesulfurarchaeum sp.]
MHDRRGSDDPAADPRARFDYQGGEPNDPELATALDRRTDGTVRFDEFSRGSYATDSSIYQVTPIGVVKPASTADVQAVLEYCHERQIPVLPRGAATSLAGQTTNEAVILDFKAEMNTVTAIEGASGTVRAQPGITLADLEAAAPANLQYGPDPAWGEKSTLGGCIGNNSTGAHSLRYEKADGYLETAEVVLADGTVTELGWRSTEAIKRAADPEGDLEARLYAEITDMLAEDAELIEQTYPDLHRNVSGYNLDAVIESAREEGRVNLARLLAGSEGTLGVITEATVRLVPAPGASAVALLHYDGLDEALADVEAVLAHDPAAVEVMDEFFLELAGTVDRFDSLLEEFPEGTGATLLVELDGERPGEVEDALADLRADRVESGPARRALEATDPEPQAAFWDLRKAGLAILLSGTGTVRPWPFVEDIAIPVEHLRAYVQDVREILTDHDTEATFYAHAGPGVLHVRPFLDLQTEDGVQSMAEIAESLIGLLEAYDGAVSGEHGDGRARTVWNRSRYGEEIWERFRSIKRAVDPNWILNPGPVGGTPDGPPDPTAALRFGPGYELDLPVEPFLDWPNERGMTGQVELCHGCGGCTGYTETTGDVMCPTYRATGEEIQSTRGRANLLRQAMDGNLPTDPLDIEFVEEVLDLCVSCQGCRRDCPSGVDMAKLKAELVHAYHRREGIPLRTRLFGHVDTLARLGSIVSPVGELLQRVPGADRAIEATLGIARERSLPTFSGESFVSWFDSRGGSFVSPKAADHRAVVFPDTYTNYSRQHVGKATVRVLEAAGVHVAVADRSDSGRPAYSKGLLDVARRAGESTVATLDPKVREGWAVVATEPSDAVMLQSDYRHLLSGPAVDRVAQSTYGLTEFLDTFDLEGEIEFEPIEGTVTYHGHCHQKAQGTDGHAVRVLEAAGFTVEELDSGCCGMAGTFGYEAEHYSMSRAIGEAVVSLIDERAGDVVVAPGGSCRTQFEDESVSTAVHPAELLESASR